MLVEDDNNLREIYGARLSAEGYEIVFAQDGEEALALAVKEKPELIVSDVMMPKISGFDMLDILRNAPETQNTKVIMMTALSQAEDQERANKLGADKYLVKSQVTLEDVVKTVKEVLGDLTPSAEGNETAEETPALSPVASQEEPTPTTVTTTEEVPAVDDQAKSEPTPSPITVTEAPEPTPVATQEVEEPATAVTPTGSSDEIPANPTQEEASAPESPAPESIVPETSANPTEPSTQSTPPVASDDQPVTSTTDDASSTEDNVSDQPTQPIQVNLPDDTATAVDDAGALPGVSAQSPSDDSSVGSDETETQPATSETEPVVAKPELPGDNQPETPTNPAIGPSLNEALEDVEKELEKEIKSTGSSADITSTAPTVANGGEVNTVVTPTEPTPDSKEEVPDQEKPVAEKEDEPTKADDTKKEDPYAVPDPVVISPTQAPPSFQPETVPPPPTNTGGIIEDQDGRKTINPINDLNSKPDLNELLAKEQAKAGLENPPVNSVISPEGKVDQPPSNAQSQSVPVTPAPAPDPNSNISL